MFDANCAMLVYLHCFLRTNSNDGRNKGGGNVKNMQIVTAKKDVRGVLDNLPKDLREEILGNKAKFQQMKKNLIT